MGQFKTSKVLSNASDGGWVGAESFEFGDSFELDELHVVAGLKNKGQFVNMGSFGRVIMSRLESECKEGLGEVQVARKLEEKVKMVVADYGQVEVNVVVCGIRSENAYLAVVGKGGGEFVSWWSVGEID